MRSKQAHGTRNDDPSTNVIVVATFSANANDTSLFGHKSQSLQIGVMVIKFELAVDSMSAFRDTQLIG